MNLRKIIFWLHLTAGVLAGTVILVMSATGVLLAFERQIVAFAERDIRTVAPPASDAPRLSLDTMVAKARDMVPEGTPSSITVSADPTVATMVNFGREQTLFVDPYTGAVQGNEATATRAFFRVVTDWHRWLGTKDDSREIGRAVTGACNAAFTVLVMSGFYLWWPRRWTRLALRAVTIPSTTLRGKPRDWNWHNTIGFWSAPALLCITVTGLVISYQWAGNLIYTLTGSEPPPTPQRPFSVSTAEGRAGRSGAVPVAAGGAPDGPAGHQTGAKGVTGTDRRGRARDNAELASASARASLDALFIVAAQQAPHWRLMTMRLPQRGATQVTVMIEEADSPHPYPRSTLTLDATTAGVVKWEPFAAYNLGRTIRSWVRPVHTGEAIGFIGQLIALLASAGGAVLMYTGLALVWRRFWQFVKRRRRAIGTAPDERRDIAPSQAP
jgi:uncharacterized iron-regulated membrane protein